MKEEAALNVKKIKRTLSDLEWLVENRADNQQSALKLYFLRTEYAAEFLREPYIRAIYVNLIGVNFSLWRSVFLSDIDKAGNTYINDADTFLINLIENNTVGYPQDRSANYWTFRYYVSVARETLRRIKKNHMSNVAFPEVGVEDPSGSAHDWWELHQLALNEALVALEDHLKSLRSNSNHNAVSD